MFTRDTDNLRLTCQKYSHNAGKVITVVTPITTEAAPMHRDGLVPLLLICTLILKWFFIGCKAYRAYKVTT